VKKNFLPKSRCSAGFDGGEPNGVTEGFHTKMEMMTRRAYGFRNFENYRLRVLTHCGWDGIINRV
jgi:transposase